MGKPGKPKGSTKPEPTTPKNARAGEFNLAKRLCELQSKLNLSQKEMAAKIGITPASLSAYQRGEKIPSFDIATRIATQCGVSLDWLSGSEQLEQMPVIDTCASVAKRFVEVLDALSDNANVQNARVEYNKNNAPEGFVRIGITQLRPISSPLSKFFDKWEDAHHLFISDVITNRPMNDEIYRAWLDKKMRELSKIPLGEL